MNEVSLLQYFEALLRERDLRLEQRFNAQGQAIGKAEVAFERRLESLNELRQDVATKGQIDGLDRRMSDLKERLDRSEGRGAGLSAGWAILVALISAAGTLVLLVINWGRL